MSKTHYIRKYKGWNFWEDKPCYYYDWLAVCGIANILNSTNITKRVTCKRCLKIMEKFK